MLISISSLPLQEPFLSPKMSPVGSSPRHPKIPHPFQALPPPPPNEGNCYLSQISPLNDIDLLCTSCQVLPH